MQNNVVRVAEVQMYHQYPLRHRFRKNVPGPFYTTGDCLACDAPESEAPDLLAPLKQDNGDTYFVRQPITPDEIERACRALEVCCVAALRYGGADPAIIKRLGNEPDYCDRLLPGGPIPRPNWLAEQSQSSAATKTERATPSEQSQKVETIVADYSCRHWLDGFPLVEETRTDGWCYGAITEFNEPECHPNGCKSGDGYVVTPDGLRLSLYWTTGAFAAKLTPSSVDERSPGSFEVAFPKPVKNLRDLVECFRSVVPQLQAIHAARLNRY
jgi:hypothetical protein